MNNASYLESKVLTAPPYRLHLMLLEGAIRFGRLAEQELQRGNQIAAATPLMRVLDIMGELLAGVREKKSDLNTKVADLYWYLFCQISQAKIDGDSTVLREALQLLDYERQTWQLLCDKLGSDNSAPPAPHSQSYGASRTPARKAGFSLEA
jgi:flagellar protein FliS